MPVSKKDLRDYVEAFEPDNPDIQALRLVRDIERLKAAAVALHLDPYEAEPHSDGVPQGLRVIVSDGRICLEGVQPAGYQSVSAVGSACQNQTGADALAPAAAAPAIRTIGFAAPSVKDLK